MSTTITATAYDVLAVIDPGQGTAPPGSTALVTVIGWVAYICLAICVLGVIIAGGKMALNARRGEAGEQAGQLGWAMAGAIVIGSASALIALVLT